MRKAPRQEFWVIQATPTQFVAALPRNAGDTTRATLTDGLQDAMVFPNRRSASRACLRSEKPVNALTLMNKNRLRLR